MDELDAIYARIAAELDARYSLGYVSGNTRLDGTWREVEVRLRTPRARRGRLQVAAAKATTPRSWKTSADGPWRLPALHRELPGVPLATPSRSSRTSSCGGDQERAIDELAEGLDRGDRHQVLLGVTGSGKTFTVANVIARVNAPAS